LRGSFAREGALAVAGAIVPDPDAHFDELVRHAWVHPSPDTGRWSMLAPLRELALAEGALSPELLERVQDRRAARWVERSRAEALDAAEILDTLRADLDRGRLRDAARCFGNHSALLVTLTPAPLLADLGTRALALDEADPAWPALAHGLAQVQSFLGQAREPIALLERVIAHPATSSRTRSGALGELGFMEYAEGIDLDSATRRFAEATEAAGSNDGLRVLHLGYSALLQGALGRPREALRILRGALGVAETSATITPNMRSWVRLLLGTSEARTGAYGDGLLRMDAAREAYEQVGDRRGMGVADLEIAWGLWAAGRPDEAREGVGRGLRLLEALGLAHTDGATAHVLLARLAHDDGHREVALEALRSAAPGLRPIERARCLVELVDRLCEADRRAEAATVFAEALPLLRAHPADRAWMAELAPEVGHTDPMSRPSAVEEAAAEEADPHGWLVYRLFEARTRRRQGRALEAEASLARARQLVMELALPSSAWAARAAGN
jgi:tetratricopeptide (TPR) repeat protein